MFEGSRLQDVPRRALGHLEYAGLAGIGLLSERLDLAYHLDAHLSGLRRLRDTARRDSQDRADPSALTWSERSWRSQNGEDGVVAEVFARIGTTNRHAVEIGASDGDENCTRHLVDNGWTAHWIEADIDKAATAAAVSPSAVTVIARPADRDTVVSMLADAGAPPEPDLLVVDIDGDDLGVLQACLGGFRPRVAVVEYNAVFSRKAMWSIRPADATGWDGTFRHGASLAALTRVAEDAGLALVHCERAGVNAFFVRRDCVAGRFADPGDLSRHFRVSSFSYNPFGHPRSRRAVAPMTPLSVEDVRAITIGDVVVTRSRVTSRELWATIALHNGSSRWLTSPQGPHGFNLALRWVTDDQELPPDQPRTPLSRPLPPGRSTAIELLVPAPSEPGAHVLRVTAVAEGVAWRELLGGAGSHRDVAVRIDG